MESVTSSGAAAYPSSAEDPPFHQVLKEFILAQLDPDMPQIPGNERDPYASAIFPDRLYLSARMLLVPLMRGREPMVRGITHLVIVHNKDEPHFPVGSSVLWKPCSSIGDVRREMDEIEPFLRAAFENPASKVVIMCELGETRSGTAMCEFLERYTGLDRETVFQFVQKQRVRLDPEILR